MGKEKENDTSFEKAILDSLTSHVAILDVDGWILATNKAWKSFASENDIRMRPDTLSANYLAVCDAALGDASDNARSVSDGIRALIEGEIDEFVMEYPCHGPDEKRWFSMKATRMSVPGPGKVVVSHENITSLKLAEEALKAREAELRLKTERLEEMNTALKVLLDRRDDDKRDMAENMTANIKQRVLPHLEKLKRGLGENKARHLEIALSGLEQIASSLVTTLSSRGYGLTPQELDIAILVREGKSTKDISDLLSISTHTVQFHRKNIRKKLGIDNSGENLRTRLLAIDFR